MIKKLTSYLLILLCFAGCHPTEYQASDENRHFDIAFDIQQNNSGVASLTFDLSPDVDYYFVSPHSKGHHQLLRFSMEDSQLLSFNGALIESPPTQEEYDELSDKQGSFVRQKTRYRQKLTIHSQDDFEVPGLIWFEIRPDCQPYEIRFVVVQQAQQLRVDRIEISTSGYPTFWDKKVL